MKNLALIFRFFINSLSLKKVPVSCTNPKKNATNDKDVSAAIQDEIIMQKISNLVAI